MSGTAQWKIIKHGEKGCADVSVEGPQGFVLFLLKEFKSRGPNNYAELISPDGKVVASTKTHPTTGEGE